MDRRRFLGAVLGAAAVRGEEGRIRIAFLGVRHPHAWEKVRIVRESPQWELAGVWAEDEEMRRKCVEAGIAALELEDLLADASIRVAAVESGVKDHARLARLALEAGKNVHVEKPAATRMSEFLPLMELAAQKKLLVQTGYMWRHHPGFRAALEAARSGWLGEIYLVRGTIHTLLNAEQRKPLAQFPGGLMFELGCHLIDPLTRLLRRAAKVMPTLHAEGKFGDGLADNTIAVFEYPRALGVITASALETGAGRRRSFEIFGTSGTAVLRPIEPGRLEIDLAEPAGPYKAGLQTVELPAYRRYAGDFDELATGRLSVTPEEETMVQEAILRASGMAG